MGDKKYDQSGKTMCVEVDCRMLKGVETSSLAAGIILGRCEESQWNEQMAFAAKVQKMATWTSYSREVQEPDMMRQVVAEIPELAIVQACSQVRSVR